MWVQPQKYGHRCFGKIRKIFEKTGILLTHDEITFLCVKPDTVILGDNKMISELHRGDDAVGLTGHNQIEEAFTRRYDGEMLQIKADGLLPIEVTPEHPLLITHCRTKDQNRKRGIVLDGSSLTWKMAKDIVPKAHHKKGDFLVIPRLSGTVETEALDLLTHAKSADAIRIIEGAHRRTFLPLSQDVAWFMGFFVAKGHTTISNKITALVFSMHRKETHLADKVSAVAGNLRYPVHRTIVGNALQLLIPASLCARAFRDWFGHKAPNKRIPDFIMYHKDDKIVLAFIEGYLAGDGFYERRRPTDRRASSSSKMLALQLQLLFARFGNFVHLYRTRRAGKSKILGRDVMIQDLYRLRGHEKRYTRISALVYDDFILTPVKRVDRTDYAGDVCNIKTEDSTYLVSNALVHNCEHLWNCKNSEEFYSKMDSMPIEELREWANKAKKKRTGLATEEELLSIYS